MQLIDNISQTLRNDLVKTIKSGSCLSIAAASFLIYAFQELKQQLKDIGELRFIFTDGQRMCTYSRLLGDTISSIVKVKENTDLFSFFDGDSGSFFGNEVHGLDDFELICFLKIR